jgi:hypothetical protein
LPRMVIVLRNGTVNRIPGSLDNPRQTWVFAIPLIIAGRAHSSSIHRDI